MSVLLFTIPLHETVEGVDRTPSYDELIYLSIGLVLIAIVGFSWFLSNSEKEQRL